jgi:hypothetical protein
MCLLLVQFRSPTIILKIYHQNRLQFANLLANLVRNFITKVDWKPAKFEISEFDWPVSNQLDDLVFIVPKFPTNLATCFVKSTVKLFRGRKLRCRIVPC